MKKLIKAIFGILFIISAISFSDFKKDNPTTTFLDSLDKKQLEKISHPFDDLSRNTWHYLPGKMWWRAGLKLKELTNKQAALFSEMLKSFLSSTGYTKVRKIIELENVLAEIENNADFRDSEYYTIAIYGKPRTDKQWSWSIEGHHLSLNFTIVDDEISATPRFLGASPATIKVGERKGERVLGNEEDFAFELLFALSESQKQEAIFQNVSFFDIVTTNATEVGPLKPVGIPTNKLTNEQKSILKKLIKEYLNSLPKAIASERERRINKEEFRNIRFGWAGAMEKGKAHYYRIQGKSFLIEFDNTQNDANHIHTVWRDFDGDFGKDILKEHYQNSDHHKH